VVLGLVAASLSVVAVESVVADCPACPSRAPLVSDRCGVDAKAVTQTDCRFLGEHTPAMRAASVPYERAVSVRAW